MPPEAGRDPWGSDLSTFYQPQKNIIMQNVLEISFVSEMKEAKNGNLYIRLDFKPFEDAEGVFNFPPSKYLWDEDLFDKVKVGMKVRM